MPTLPPWRRRLRYLLWETDTEAVEGFIALNGLARGWGMLIGDGIRLNPAWGLFLILAGGLQLFAVFHGDRGRRLYSAQASLIAWVLIVGLLILAHEGAAILASYVLTALAAGWSYLRLSYMRGEGGGDASAH